MLKTDEEFRQMPLETISANLGIERHKLSEIPLYILPDKLESDRVLECLEAQQIPYGIEFGPGGGPSNLKFIDPNIQTWVLYEPDSMARATFMSDIEYLWQDGYVDKNALLILSPSPMGNTTLVTSTALRTVVYRNPDYRDYFPLPTQELLKEKGMRLVFIVDCSHVGEITQYDDFLTKYGFPRPPYTSKETSYFSRRIYDEGYVLDTMHPEMWE